ncbi:hypothetical protein SAMN02949497_3433 [Methylomagnum ishizawai]|uniref:Uncharacterized protein n=1 Tax=Methylomagnum ishizawai TaxID=1760988 RepID=A0A1Y6D5B5_9GAMM|nr:hypothetical protein [Methylomagnum ishizawai]SMF96053.1 hypothetical protein SAMN02949497_3433 [Methylomagnum ishizawai]
MARIDPIPQQPWERQPGESETAYAAFRRYRDMPMGERSIRRSVGEDASAVKVRRAEQWSVDFRWVERAAAYTDHLDRIARQERERAIRDMERRHAHSAQAIHAVVNAKLAAWNRTPEAREAAAEALTPYQLARLLDTATRVERAALGHVPDPPPKKPDRSALLAELAEVKAKAREGGDWNLYFQALREERAITGEGTPIAVKAEGGDWKADLQAAGMDPDAVFEEAVRLAMAKLEGGLP